MLHSGEIIMLIYHTISIGLRFRLSAGLIGLYLFDSCQLNLTARIRENKKGNQLTIVNK